MVVRVEVDDRGEVSNGMQSPIYCLNIMVKRTSTPHTASIIALCSYNARLQQSIEPHEAIQRTTITTLPSQAGCD
ncbi:hypothetical protein VTK56DRAFT_3211 [Thermocarpiscus australiensis]